MSRYPFTPAERWAVFSVHGDTCYLCTKPLDYTSMQVDHVVPEHLLDTPEELAAVLESLGLPANFDLNSFENWLPAHGACNRLKSGTPFTPAPIVVSQLQRAARKAASARALAQKAVSDRKLGNALAVIEVAASSEDLPFEKIEPAVRIFLQSHPDAVRAILDEAAGRDDGTSSFRLGLQVEPSPVLELRLTPFAKVIYYPAYIELVSIPVD